VDDIGKWPRDRDQKTENNVSGIIDAVSRKIWASRLNGSIRKADRFVHMSTWHDQFVCSTGNRIGRIEEGVSRTE
jgi:hypothetical protein